MTYLSQIWVGRDEAARQRFRDTYAWHQALWKAFPGRCAEPRRFLFRIDDKHQKFRVLLLAPDRPVLPDWGKWQTKEVPGSFLAHERYQFQLRANPTVKRVIRAADGTKKKNGRRTGIYDPTELQAWLERKAEQAGFGVSGLVIGPPMESHFFNKNRKRGKHNSVDFQGALLVKERKVFERAFHKGIGPAKAFGFGLLMLEPVARDTGRREG